MVLKNVHRALLRRFPYSLFLVIEDETLIVIACLHGRRDPAHWQARTKNSRNTAARSLPINTPEFDLTRRSGEIIAAVSVRPHKRSNISLTDHYGEK